MRKSVPDATGICLKRQGSESSNEVPNSGLASVFVSVTGVHSVKAPCVCKLKKLNCGGLKGQQEGCSACR